MRPHSNTFDPSVENKLNGLSAYAGMLERALIPHELEENACADGRHPFIPLNTWEFTKWLVFAKDLRVHLYSSFDRPKFLDVGCGIGTKVALAHYLGVHSYGLEVNPEYLEIARKKFHIESSRLYEEDARKFTGYGEFGIIYFYCPMREPFFQEQLEQAVYKGAKDGTILIEVLKQSGGEEEEPDLHRLAGPLYIKTTNKGLLRRAKSFFKRDGVKDEIRL